MSLVFAKRKSQLMAIGAIMIVSGIHIKNSLDQMGDETTNRMPGILLFVCGWAAVAWAIGTRGDNHTIVPMHAGVAGLCAAAIVFAAMQMKKTDDPETKKYYAMLCGAAWIVLGGIAGWNGGFWNKVFGFAAPALMIGATMYVLPKARDPERPIVDNPGYSLCALAWICLWIAVAMK